MESTVQAEVHRMVGEAGAHLALSEALIAAGLDRVPEQPLALAQFLDQHLMEALVGHLHPTTAGQLIVSIRNEVLVPLVGQRPRSRGPEDTATVPPPANDGMHQAYEDLATGAIHTRATPAWGLRQALESASQEEALWIVVSNDGPLVEMARGSAPIGTEVLVPASTALFTNALTRAQHPGSAVILDAEHPSVPLDRSFAVLTETAGHLRVVLWRMPSAERQRMVDAMPHTRNWLPCDAEVTPAEIVQLLGAQH